MTEQEAQALATRLTRVWMPERVGEVPFGWKLTSPRQDFEMKLSFLNGLEFHYRLEADSTAVIKLLERGSLGRIGHLEFRSGWRDARCAKATGQLELQSNFNRFAAKWTPFFRRGCWLSGYPLEASAHEKIEWIRGFTKEEIESWNLTF